ncbi:MAG: universal stress protein [Clostridiales bacterium]|jgi:nucleotide-binding universal stress UspA family protein|nr:universal stress protein [Clostridiales bacterium]
MKKILVAVDGSAESKKAAAQAVLLAGKFGAEVTLLTVVEVENDVAYTEFGIVSGEYTGVRDTLVRIRTENSGKMLDAIIAGLDCTGIPVKKLIKVGTAHPEIAEEAAGGKYDLIVMGHRGLNPVKRFFMGSVAKRVIEDAPCSVLIVKE